MTCIVAIDPGSAGKGCACAAFVDGVLVESWFERVPTFKSAPTLPPVAAGRWARAAGLVDVVVVEALGTRGAGDGAKVKNLVQLAWDGALLAGAFAGRDGAPIVALTPAEWKGSEPKPAQHWRAWQLLSERERVLLGGAATQAMIAAAREKGALSRWSKPGASYYPKAWDMHNRLDAACLGLTYLGRLKRVA